MKTTAFTANLALVALIGWYLSNLTGLTTNLLELLVLVFALASPVANILALLPKRGLSRAGRLVAVTTSLALMVALFAYLIAHHRIRDFDMEWPEVMMFLGMFIVPVLSIIALIFSRQTDASNKAKIVESCVPGKGSKPVL